MEEWTRGGDRGAVLVEFALVVPLLLLFMFAIVQFGIAYDRQQSVTASARQAARFATLEGADDDAIEEQVRAALQDAGIDAAPTISITPDRDVPCEDRAGGTVAVSVAIDHLVDIPFAGRRTVTLDNESVFLCE